MHSTPRAFAYGNATLFLGVIIFFFTQEMIPYVEQQGWIGTLFTTAFILIFLNLSFVISRRFCRKAIDMEAFPYIIAAILVLPTLVLTHITQRFDVLQMQVFFFILVVAASMLGAYLGMQKGLQKRDEYLSETSGKEHNSASGTAADQITPN